MVIPVFNSIWSSQCDCYHNEMLRIRENTRTNSKSPMFRDNCHKGPHVMHILGLSWFLIYLPVRPVGCHLNRGAQLPSGQLIKMIINECKQWNLGLCTEMEKAAATSSSRIFQWLIRLRMLQLWAKYCSVEFSWPTATMESKEVFASPLSKWRSSARWVFWKYKSHLGQMDYLCSYKKTMAKSQHQSWHNQ